MPLFVIAQVDVSLGGYSHIVWVVVCRWVRRLKSYHLTRVNFANFVTQSRVETLNCSSFQSFVIMILSA